jgi:heme-degrading monooxygenase HmoA
MTAPDLGVRVLVFARADADDVDAVPRAYHSISAALAGTPGLLGNELLQSIGGGAEFAVLSQWSSWDAFSTWERGADHRATTAPLRPFQDGSAGSSFRIYRVAARYGGTRPPSPVQD